jgi:glutamine---fructose-6-phosphate transaminase (isomerizing)
MLRSGEVDNACATAARALVRSEQVPPILVIGQGVLHVAGREIALKVKELTAIPTESFPSRELKHGPIAMLKAGTPVIFCAAGLREDTVVNQVQSRGGFAIGIVEEGSPLVGVFDLIIEVPAGPSPLEQFLPTLVAGQLIALKLTELLGKNPDRPANLAKSATTR